MGCRLYRVGAGHDSHRLVGGRPLILGGVRIEHPLGLSGHSDADVVLHALTDALLCAAGLGDIGDHSPDTEPAHAGADSRRFLAGAAALIAGAGWRIGNVGVTIFAEEPKLGPSKAVIRANLAKLLGVTEDAVNVQAKTGEGVGPIGRCEAIGCSAIVLLER